jgi:MFS family permease
MALWLAPILDITIMQGKKQYRQRDQACGGAGPINDNDECEYHQYRACRQSFIALAMAGDAGAVASICYVNADHLASVIADGAIWPSAGFMGGVMIAAVSAFTQGIAILISNFWLFCVASMFLGIAHGCAGFYRYAAADSAEESQKPKAISYVLAGGLLAAFMGPEIARNTVDFVPGHLYAGCFFSVAAVQLVSLGFLSGVKIPKPELTGSGGRPIGRFFKMPIFVVGVISAAIGYAMMSYMMTATPLQVVNVAKLGTSANATIIQWHVVAMFAPAFFTGNLIARFGAPIILTSGVLIYLAAIASALLGDGFWWYFVALACMGLGWNFLYIGGSSLVASVANPEERGRVQGIADLVTTTSVATASLAAGALHSQFGWEVMVLSALGPVMIIAMALAWLGMVRRPYHA